MSKKLLIFATKNEANATISVLKAKQIEYHTPPCYAFDQGWIILSGIGTYSAQMAAATTFINQIDEMWNIGIAGALNPDLPIGKMLLIKKIGKYIPSGPLDPLSQEYATAAAPNIAFEKGIGKLISSDFPIHTKEHHLQLSKNWDLVDMEGYGIAHASHFLGKKCRMWKVVSDFASPGGRALIKGNTSRLSDLMAETIIQNMI